MINEITHRDTEEANSRTYKRNAATVRDTGEDALARMEKRIANRNREATNPIVEAFRNELGQVFQFAKGGGGSVGRPTTLPWKVTANGDDTVAVAPGKVLSFNHEQVSIPAAGSTNLSSYFNLVDFASYAGGDVTVTTTGFIYLEIDYSTAGGAYASDTYDNLGGDDFTHSLESVRPSGAITVNFGALPTSGDKFVVKIAEVSLDSGVAQVDEQILTHNPTLFAQQIVGSTTQ